MLVVDACCCALHLLLFLFLLLHAVVVVVLWRNNPGFTALLPDLALGESVVLHQRNMAGADGRTAAAFDTVEQVVVLGAVKLSGLAVPVQLLG